MAYQEITSNKTVNLTSDEGYITLSYYAGNKNNKTNSFIGNAYAALIDIDIPDSIDWIYDAWLDTRDDTALNIIIGYEQNDTGSDRQCALKLSNGSGKYSAYTVTLLLKAEESVMPEEPEYKNYTIKWNVTFNNQCPSGAEIQVVLSAFIKFFMGSNSYMCYKGMDNSWEISFDKKRDDITLNKNYSWTHSYNNMYSTGTYNIPDHNFNVAYEELYNESDLKKINIDIDGNTILLYNGCQYKMSYGVSTNATIINVRNSNIIITDDTITINLNYIADNVVIDD